MPVTIPNIWDQLQLQLIMNGNALRFNIGKSEHKWEIYSIIIMAISTSTFTIFNDDPDGVAGQVADPLPSVSCVWSDAGIDQHP